MSRVHGVHACSDDMTVTVNGERKECVEGTTLAQLVAALKLDGTTLVAEVSGAVVARERYAATVLKSNDTVELVRFVGGG
jgi:sulfur carrier protein